MKTRTLDRTRRRVLAASTLAPALLALPALAQPRFPERAITIVVPFAPGGASDAIARPLAQKLGEVLKQTVVVINRPGAAGNIGLEMAARSPADGYTMLLGNVSVIAINPATFARTLRVNVGRDLVGVSKVASVPSMLAASAQYAPNSVAELIKDAKARPGAVNYGSAGVGSFPMLDMLEFKRAAGGLNMVHIPYPGGAGPIVTALARNEVQISFVNVSSAIGLIEGGRLKALAVTTPQRLPRLPQVQTMAEAGFPGIGTNAWQGLFVPAATPRAVVQQLHAAVQTVLADPELKQRFDEVMIDVQGNKSLEEFALFVANQSARWANVVREFNVTVDQ